MPKKPFTNLKNQNVESIEIVAANFGRKFDGVYLLEDDKEKVLSIIKDIKITGRYDDSDSNSSQVEGGYTFSEMYCIRTNEEKTIRLGLNTFPDKLPIIYIDFIEYDLDADSIKICEELTGYYLTSAKKYGLDYYLFK